MRNASALKHVNPTDDRGQGRLSIVCENKVHFHGTVRYAVTGQTSLLLGPKPENMNSSRGSCEVQFTDGELCSADGAAWRNEVQSSLGGRHILMESWDICERSSVRLFKPLATL